GRAVVPVAQDAGPVDLAGADETREPEPFPDLAPAGEELATRGGAAEPEVEVVGCAARRRPLDEPGETLLPLRVAEDRQVTLAGRLPDDADGAGGVVTRRQLGSCAGPRPAPRGALPSSRALRTRASARRTRGAARNRSVPGSRRRPAAPGASSCAP